MDQQEQARSARPYLLEWLYRWRWPLALVSVALSFAVFAGGLAQVSAFTARVDSLKEEPPAVSQPKMFDTRTDIWFDPQNEGMTAYRDVEAQFIAEDVVLVAFEEKNDPWGVFGTGALERIGVLTREFAQVPYVRNVRSLTSSPWIRAGEVAPGEKGLIVSDLFDRPVASYSREERLERMIAVLGAERAARLAGEGEVRELLGPEVHLDDHPGEPRFVDSIVSSDGRTAALQLQVIRERPPAARLDAAFPDQGDPRRAIGKALHTIDAQGSAVSVVIDKLERGKASDARLTGIPVIERHFPEVGQRDMAWLGLMFLVIGLALLLLYRRASGVALPLLVVIGSILAMNGLVWLKGDLVNNLTASAPVIMTAVGIADAVHLVSAYFLHRREFSERRALIVDVLQRNALPVFLTSLTTAVAFLSLTVSPIVPVRMLGYTAAIGTLSAYLLSMTLVPALLSLLPLRATSDADAGEARRKDAGTVAATPERSYWTDGLARFVQVRRVPILVATGLVLGFSALGVSRVRVESDLRTMFPETDPVVADQNWIEDRLGGSGDLDLVFYGAKAERSDAELKKAQMRAEVLELRALGGEVLSERERDELSQLKVTLGREQRGRIAANAEFLETVDRFEQRLRRETKEPGSPLAVLTSFDSGLSVLRRMHQVMNENRAAFYRVPVEADVGAEARTTRVLHDPFTGERALVPAQSASTLAAQYYVQYENGAKPAENLGPFVTPDRRGFRIAARVAGQPSADMMRAYDRIRTIAAAEFPTIAGTEESVASGQALATMRLTGKHYLFMNVSERFTETMTNSLAIALAVITLLMAIVFRSIRLALVSMVPNVLPLFLPLAFMGVLGMPLDGPAVIVATVALGVCVDDTIHLLAKFTRARRQGLPADQAILWTFRQVGGALTWTSITLVLGFSVLALADFRPNMLIGALGAVMVALAWLADMVVTPALLSLVSPDESPEAQETTALTPASAE